MRPILRPILHAGVWLAATAVAAVVVVCPACAWGQQHAADPPPASGASSSPAPAQTSVQGDPAAESAPQQDSLADAARKARGQKKESKTPKVFTNDNIPTSGGISTVGTAAPAGEPGATADAGAAAKKEAKSGGDEKAWRDKFARLRSKLDQDKADVDVMQRELGVLNVQYYNDPVKAMQQGLTRDDINKKTADIEAKKQAIIADQQAIDDAEDDLRKAGGDAGWSR
jgi:hypothetical protein